MKYSNKLFVLVALFASTFSVLGQGDQKLDSLLSVYESLPNDTTKVILLNDLFGYYIYKNPIKAKEYADLQNELATKVNYEKGIGASFNKMASYFGRIGKIDSAKIYYGKALAIYEKIGWLDGQAGTRFNLTNMAIYEEGGDDKKLEMLESDIEFYKKINDSIRLGKAYLSQAVSHMSKGNYKIALGKNIEALKILEERANDMSIAEAYRFMGIIECELKNSREALKYSKKAISVYEANGAKTLVGRVLNTMGITYDEMEYYHKADSVYEKAYAIAKEQNDPYEQKLALINHSRSFEKHEDFVNSMKKLKLYLELDENSENKNQSSLGLIGMGTALMNSDQAVKALGYLDDALVFAKKENVKSRLHLTYLNRAKTNVMLNNFKDAYEDYVEANVYKDSMYDETKTRQIEEMRAIFDTEKKEQQIAQQETELELLEEKDRVSSLQKWLLGLGLGLSLLVFGLGFYGVHQKMKRNKVEKENLDAELAFKKKELTTHAMHLAKKNEVLEAVKQKAKELKTSENGERSYRQLIQAINFDQHDDRNWKNFTQYFEQVHKDFSKTVREKYPEVTKNELRLMALLKMNLSSKEIATILNISSDGIKKARQRLRKKMELSPEESLESTVLSL